jgi:hypothetical protein
MRPVTHALVVAPHLGALAAMAGTLKELTARRVRVHIAVLDDPPPGVDVSAFAGQFRRGMFGRLPPLDRWTHLSMSVRSVLDRWRLDPASGAAAIRRPAAQLLRLVHRALPPSPSIVGFLEAYRPEILIVTSMFDVGSFIPDYLNAANQLGIPSVALPARWDDLSGGAWPHVIPDALALWNREQRRQAVEVLGVPARRTVMLGACLPLDLAGAVTTTRDTFCNRYQIDPARSVVLLAVGRTEADRLESIRACVDRLRASSDARVRDASIVAYWPPPAGVLQRERPGLAEPITPRPAADPKEYAAEITEALHHADLVIADNMTIVLDAAARARPLVALIQRDEELARFCRDEGRRGWPRVADGLPALDSTVATCLREGLDRAGAAAARTIVRPHGDDLSPGFLMYAKVLNEIIGRLAPPRTVPRWVLWFRAVLAPVASLVARRAGRLPVHRERRDAAKVLIAAPSAPSLFLHLPIVRTLAERGHHVSLAFTARRNQPVETYEELKCDVPNVASVGVLAPPSGMWAAIADGLLGMSAYVSMLDRHAAGAMPRWLAQLAPTLLTPWTRPIATLARKVPGMRKRVQRLASRLDRAIPSSAGSKDLLGRAAPDVVLTLPDIDLIAAHQSAAAQADLVRGASSLGIPTASIATGPDAQLHATSLQPRPTMVLVWNDEQRTTVIRDLNLEDRDVLATGAVSLDRSLNEPPIVPDDEFRGRLGLPVDRPFVFFCGSPGIFGDERREIDLLGRWVTSLRESTDPALRELPVLIRPPVHAQRWRRLDFAGLGPVVLGPRRYEEPGQLDVVLLAESVRYAAVTVGIDGLSLTLAAALGKPAVAITRAEAGHSDHVPLEFLWKTPGSSVTCAASLEDLNWNVRAALDRAPSQANPFRDTLARCRNGQRPCDLTADAIERLAGRRVAGPLLERR